ncbi:MAG: toll/interleukin-1 receptor domain-containing protein [Bryobacteraceae bacterium]|nr:toll/interleukin-1 receptor domain-containing protein [Bryobacteraceae bacterium]
MAQGYTVFLSYARANQSPQLDKFQKRLRKEILDKTDVPEDQILFFDTTEIKTGVEWRKALADSLRTSKCLVCLCTPRYQSSQYCGKEVQVFLLRRQHFMNAEPNQGRKASLIYPVLWERPGAGLHQQLTAFNFADSGFPKKYVDKGLKALASLQSERDNFVKTVMALADRILDSVKESDLPEWPPLPDFEKIPSIFHGDDTANAYGYSIVMLHPEKAQWKPFGIPASTLCDTVAAQTSRVCRQLPAGPDLVDRIFACEDRRESVAVITDFATISTEGSLERHLLDEISKKGMRNCAVVVLADSSLSSQDAYTHAFTKLSSDFPDMVTSEVPHCLLAIRSTVTFLPDLIRTLERVNVALLKRDTPTKLEDDQSRQAAKELGVDTDVNPTLSGPGQLR